MAKKAANKATTSRATDADARREGWSPQELVLTYGIGADIRALRAEVSAADRPGSFRAIADTLGWKSHADIDKYEKAERRIGLPRYIALMGYMFDRLPAKRRQQHPAGMLMQDPAVAAMVSGGMSEDTPMADLLIAFKSLHDTGAIDANNRIVQLFTHLTKLGEEEIRKSH